MRNVRHVCDGGFPRGRLRDVATVVCAISMPSFCSSPWMRGASHSGLTACICWMRARMSTSVRNGHEHKRCLVSGRDRSEKRDDDSTEACAMRLP